MKSKRIQILYFGPLREHRRKASETVMTQASEPGALYAELRTAHGFGFEQRHLSLAVNDELASWNQALEDGDCVAFLPPVSGG